MIEVRSSDPVIHLNVAKANCESIELLHLSLCKMIRDNATDLQLSLSDEPNSALLFNELIRKAQNPSKLVILIDEYDKPLTESVDYENAVQIRQLIK